MSFRAETGSIHVPKPSSSSNHGRALTEQRSGVDLESVQAPRRRRFSPSYKRNIVEQANACTEPGAVGALLRREGLYSSHLVNWRRQFEAGGTAALAGKKPGRKPKKSAEQRRIEQLEKDNAKLERELRIARSLLDLQKKASELLGITLEPPEESDDES